MQNLKLQLFIGLFLGCGLAVLAAFSASHYFNYSKTTPVFWDKGNKYEKNMEENRRHMLSL